MRNKIEMTAAALTLVPSLAAFAHPGDHSHESTGSLLWHFLSQPDHVMYFTVVATVSAGIVWFYRNRKAENKTDKS